MCRLLFDSETVRGRKSQVPQGKFLPYVALYYVLCKSCSILSELHVKSLGKGCSTCVCWKLIKFSLCKHVSMFEPEFTNRNEATGRTTSGRKIFGRRSFGRMSFFDNGFNFLSLVFGSIVVVLMLTDRLGLTLIKNY